MKTFYRIALLIAAIAISTCMVACGDDNDDPGLSYSQAIIGTWNKTADSDNIFDFTHIEFKSNGTAVAYTPDNSSIIPGEDTSGSGNAGFKTENHAYVVTLNVLRLYDSATPDNNYKEGELTFFTDGSVMYKYVIFKNGRQVGGAHFLELAPRK